MKKIKYIIFTIFLMSFKISTTLAATCEGIFGRTDDPNSLKHLINEILMYPKIIVPIIVIGLGTLDLVKAVTASNEDKMKKAQQTLFKRILIGVAIFFPIVFLCSQHRHTSRQDTLHLQSYSFFSSLLHFFCVFFRSWRFLFAEQHKKFVLYLVGNVDVA